MLERTSLLKIALAAVFAASLAALPLTLRAQEATTTPAAKADPATKGKKKAAATKKATETAEPKATQNEPVDPPATTTDAKGKQLSPGQIAVRERQRKCGAEWRGLSKDEQAKKGGTWPKYWSACNTRLKAEAQPAQPKGKKG